jgi:hypothetical protein
MALLATCMVPTEGGGSLGSSVGARQIWYERNEQRVERLNRRGGIGVVESAFRRVERAGVVAVEVKVSQGLYAVDTVGFRYAIAAV